MDPLIKARSGQPLRASEAQDLALDLFVVGYEGDAVPEAYAEELRRGLAGVILFRRNLHYDVAGTVDVDHVCALTAHIHELGNAQPGGLPVLCSVDQEGGAVARLRAPFTLFPPMRRLGETDDLTLLADVGRQLGRELAAAGFNVDYAPVLDVDTNPANPIIGDRAFARHAEAVAVRARALLRAMQAEGVVGCGKHFPGHGDTDTDSHLDLPVLRHDLDRLKAIELVPFQRLAHDLRLVMTAHVLFPAVDPKLPATLAPEILGPLLRVHCGYQGVVVSDDLEMQGIAKVFEPGPCVVQGLAAGVDLFLVCRRRDVWDRARAAAADVLAGMHGPAAQARAVDAIDRVRQLRRGLVSNRPDAGRLRAIFADPHTERLRARLAAGTLAAAPVAPRPTVGETQ
ncbi:MAG: beta-N-acetylhexosaminidase [Deltaproteobacteria bacterium]|nr:beta-N-acetylhexosaminidase [Deltaproteobacteria bacterium]